MSKKKKLPGVRVAKNVATNRRKLSEQSGTPTVSRIRPQTKRRIRPTKTGKIAKIRHFDFSKDELVQFSNQEINASVLRRFKNAPSGIDFTLEPLENDHLVYHLTPGFTSKEKRLAQLSIRATVWNKGGQTVDLDKVVIIYKKQNVNVQKSVFLPADQLVIDPGYGWNWQNSRDYHENGDVVFLQSPFPTSVKLSFYFKGYSSPVSISKKLKPYNKGFAFPFDAKDFEDDEHVTGYSMHGGGDQVFAYDMGTEAYRDDAWRHLHPNKNGTENDHYRIWGKPIRAMADGEVIHFLNNVPNNWKPDGSDAGMKKQKEELWGSFDKGGAGNHLYIKHGDLVALYAHFQKGSIPRKFAKNGAMVKKGDKLGLAGNSGNSSGPHLHVHIKKFKNNNEPEGGAFRPLLFNTGYTIGKAKYPEPKSNVNWAELDNEGIPGLKDKACFISSSHPYCEYPKTWAEVARHGIPESKYQDEFDKIWPCGYYPIWVDGYDVKGKTYFNMIFRQAKGIGWVARHNMGGTKYQTEFNKWVDKGYRLININSYLLNGKLRYAAVWQKDKSVKWFAYHGRSLTWHESNFEKHYKAGWVPRNVSCTHLGGKTYVAALWEKTKPGGFYLRPVMSLQNFKDYFDDYTNKKKFKLVYLDGFTINGQPRLSGIWYKNAPNYNSWWEKYHLTSSQYQNEYTSMLSNGYLTRALTGYAHNGIARFEGIWSK